MSDNQNNPVAANFLQHIKNVEIVDFMSFTRDWMDDTEELKVVFMTLPNDASGKLVSGYNEDVELTAVEDAGNKNKEKLYSITDIKYIVNTGDDSGSEVSEATFEYYIVDSNNYRSEIMTVTINPSNEQETDVSSQLIGTGNDNILIANPYQGHYIWGAGGNDILIGNEGKNAFVIDHSSTKFNKTTTTIANLKIFEDKIDLSHLICVQNIGDISIDSKSNNTQITFKGSTAYPQEILLEKIIPATVLENYKEIFVFNSNKNDIENKCNNSIFKDFVSSKYTWMSCGFTMGALTMKLLSCICSRFEKSAEITMNIPTDRSIATMSNLNKSFMSEDKVPIGITFEEGREIELISLKNSNTYFKYNEVASKTSWVSKSDGILFYDYNKSMFADHKKIVMK